MVLHIKWKIQHYIYVKKIVKYQADLISAYGIDLDVKTSDQIKIGGFIIENKANNVVIDESLDFALENQKDWFYKTSGLMIK